MSSEGTSNASPTKSDDLPYAIAILVIAIVLVVIGVIYAYFNSNKSGLRNDGLGPQTFTAPPERQQYIDAKENLSSSNLTPSDIEDLKKLLIRRAFQSIPLLLSLQNEGNSIERLYKRGILTDDMHYRVKDLKTFFDKEFQDVQNEAEELVEGWGPHIWPQAIQYYQLVQKQIEEKADGGRLAEESKRKQANEKKRDKEKAKKLALKENNQSSPLISLDSNEIKALEAEKMAQQLIDEEERNNKKK
eukprot:CAMPEP_0196765758 /NCGR_PEP_ID=MMETSP1095-20130614/11878_1 /TAXON_ID=96789 ORGANISM="Chromulina nebulosa, Strain UTEXLB2642" /NCGR_SAMPLE_ID=MMETSP1095 /ASSEMBLY_ACC=CAM_ASM_000446 /LENGTH=245 /DNA_ID=CAMNT_0042124383 /DNA_START=1 /DNA_END=735 /DNA_ORIENTATION=+